MNGAVNNHMKRHRMRLLAEPLRDKAGPDGDPDRARNYQSDQYRGRFTPVMRMPCGVLPAFA
jgi:hypothetical protein